MLVILLTKLKKIPLNDVSILEELYINKNLKNDFPGRNGYRVLGGSFMKEQNKRCYFLSRIINQKFDDLA